MKVYIEIDASKELPKEEGFYLIPNNKYKKESCAEFHLYGEFKGKWTVDDINGYEYEKTVTHWLKEVEIPRQEDMRDSIVCLEYWDVNQRESDTFDSGAYEMYYAIIKLLQS